MINTGSKCFCMYCAPNSQKLQKYWQTGKKSHFILFWLHISTKSRYIYISKCVCVCVCASSGKVTLMQIFRLSTKKLLLDRVWIGIDNSIEGFGKWECWQNRSGNGLNFYWLTLPTDLTSYIYLELNFEVCEVFEEMNENRFHLKSKLGQNWSFLY